jgi:hypothetical protein
MGRKICHDVGVPDGTTTTANVDNWAVVVVTVSVPSGFWVTVAGRFRGLALGSKAYSCRVPALAAEAPNVSCKVRDALRTWSGAPLGSYAAMSTAVIGEAVLPAASGTDPTVAGPMTNWAICGSVEGIGGTDTCTCVLPTIAVTVVGAPGTTAITTGVGESAGASVGVAVEDAVAVAEGVAVSVAATVGLGDAVALDESVRVGVTLGDAIAVAVAVGGSGVRVPVTVGDGVAEAVGLPVGVRVGGLVLVADGVGVALAVAVRVGVRLGVGEAVPLAVGVLVGDAVAVRVGLAVLVAVGERVGVALAVAVPVRLGVAVALAVGVGVEVAGPWAATLTWSKVAVPALLPHQPGPSPRVSATGSSRSLPLVVSVT